MSAPIRTAVLSVEEYERLTGSSAASAGKMRAA
jgi:hypothetical protein